MTYVQTEMWLTAWTKFNQIIIFPRDSSKTNILNILIDQIMQYLIYYISSFLFTWAELIIFQDSKACPSSYDEHLGRWIIRGVFGEILEFMMMKMNFT